MPADKQDMAAELAYVRALAEEGRNAPLVGGAIYAVWGGLIGAASLMQYAAAAGWLALPGSLGWAPWVGAFAIGWALSLIVGARSARKPGAMTVGNCTASSAWLGVGLFISGLFLTLMIVHDNYAAAGLPPYFLFSLMFPVAFGLYGVAFLASATAARLDWLKWFAYASWGFAFASLFLLGDSRQMLLAAAGSFVCALTPGLLLMRREPSETV